MSASFLDRVAHHAPSGIDAAVVRGGTHAMLLHLRKVLPMEAETRLLDALPGAVRQLSGTSELENKYRRGWRHIELTHRERLVKQIRHESGAADDNEGAALAGAVLAATVEALSAEDALYVRSQLPQSLRAMWEDAVWDHACRSAPYRTFRAAVHHHVSFDSEAQFDAVVRIAVPLVLRRLGTGANATQVRRLPEEVRVVAPAVDPLQDDADAPDLVSVETVETALVNQVGLSPDDAAAAVLGLLRGIKATVRPRHSAVVGRLPKDWRRAWNRG